MTQPILMIDNYDSFVFNVARYFEELGREVKVIRNDAIDVAGIRRFDPSALVISPGPGTPQDAGISLEAIRALNGELPILGVCLGHQCLGAMYGAPVAHAKRPLHGIASMIEHNGRNLFEGIASPLKAGRYHSLIVEETPELLAAIDIDAVSEEGEIMALSHKHAPTYGVQFHPESILTEHGHKLFANFLKLADARNPSRVLV
jgi:para-aminobenzoate synthetase component 2